MPAETVHIVPVNDLREHDTDGGPCACQPTTEAIREDDGRLCGRIVVHNAWDKRELREYDHKARAAGPS